MYDPSEDSGAAPPAQVSIRRATVYAILGMLAAMMILSVALFHA